MRWGHATRLPKPPYADSRRHSGVNASILARAPRGNRPPEWSTILAQDLLRPARRSQSCLHTPIRTPVSLHRNLLLAEVLRRPVESALGRPVKPGVDNERSPYSSMNSSSSFTPGLCRCDTVLRPPSDPVTKGSRDDA